MHLTPNPPPTPRVPAGAERGPMHLTPNPPPTPRVPAGAERGPMHLTPSPHHPITPSPSYPIILSLQGGAHFGQPMRAGWKGGARCGEQGCVAVPAALRDEDGALL